MMPDVRLASLATCVQHYVVNTESLEGVCVRHTDDCTPVCVPRGEGEPWRRRVCSKGSVNPRARVLPLPT